MVEPLLPHDPPQLGSYQVVGRLGAGGQGVVYLGQAPNGSQVAIKSLTMDATADPNFLHRFAREAEAARQVASFCTAAVLDADFTARPPYIVSEYVQGPSIAESVRTRGPLTGGDLHRVAVAMATALMAIHEAGIVHRDLKPANVLLGEGGARVIDFGVARVSQGTGTETNTSIGTPAFMAPEQIAGDPISPKADVFAWGAVVAFAASGRQPFEGDSVPAILHQVLNEPPNLSGVPDSLRGLVAAALSKDPNQRPTSTDVLMTLIGRTERPADQNAATQVLREGAATAITPAVPAAAQAETMVAPPVAQEPGERAPHRAERGEPPRRGRGPIVAAAAGGLVVGLLLGVVLGWVLSPTAAPEPAAAETDTQEEPEPEETPDSQEAEQEPEEETTDAEDEQPAQAPRFPADYDGDWVGETPGLEWELSVEEGDRSATIESDDCEYDIVLTGESEGTYEAAAASDDSSCWSDTAALTHEGGIITVEIGDAMGTADTIQFERD